ncbi:MAG: bifunctional nuclease family protein [Tannerellaceae bacterium]|nr:bifunctional nuclease family protein [Tannerellaceae bacterium]
MDTKIKLTVQGLTDTQTQAGAYTLVLAEEDSNMKLPIIIGMAEAQSILIAHESIRAPRPLSHDLMVTLIKTFNVTLREVYIYKCKEGVFFAELLLSAKDGRDVRVDARTSDAVALALRAGCDIFVSAQILKECGVAMDEIDDDDEEFEFEDEEDAEEDLSTVNPEYLKDDTQRSYVLSKLDNETLNSYMAKAIRDENYELAKQYRDELQRRSERNSSN